MILKKYLHTQNNYFRSMSMVIKGSVRILTQILGNQLASTKSSGHLDDLNKRGIKDKGIPFLLLKNNEKDKVELACTSCNLCIEICPPECLDLVKPSEKGVAPKEFSLEVLKCTFCGLCEDICPEDAIRMGPERTFAGESTDQWVWNKEELSRRNSLNEGEGVFVGEQLIQTNVDKKISE